MSIHIHKNSAVDDMEHLTAEVSPNPLSDYKFNQIPLITLNITLKKTNYLSLGQIDMSKI